MTRSRTRAKMRWYEEFETLLDDLESAYDTETVEKIKRLYAERTSRCVNNNPRKEYRDDDDASRCFGCRTRD